MTETDTLVPVERVEQHILRIRGHNIMLDKDLSVLYGVSIKALNQAVKRNVERFPEDFMFQLYGRIRELEVTICDLKFLGRTTLSTLCLY